MSLNVKLTSKIPLTEISESISAELKKTSQGSGYAVSYRANSSIERVEVWPAATSFFGRVFGKPVIEVSRERRGLRTDMPNYSTQNESLISSSRLRELVYGTNGNKPL